MSEVSAAEIRALPYPAGCPGFSMGFNDAMWECYRRDGPQTVSCLAAIWWFRERAAACEEHLELLEDAYNEAWHATEDKKRKLKLFSDKCAADRIIHAEFLDMLSCADAWESILRRIQR